MPASRVLLSGACVPSLCPVAGAILSFLYPPGLSFVINLCGEQVVDSTAELLAFVHTAGTALDVDITEQSKEDQSETAQVHRHTSHYPLC